MRGRFIVLEGGEGTGKSTHAVRIAEALRARGHQVVTTREPGGTPEGAHLRNLLLDDAWDWPAPAELFLYLADRAAHVANLIRPALDRGAWVISDRFEESTIAYQVHGRGLDPQLVERVNAIASSGLRPDLTMILELPEGEGLQRALLRGTADRFEAAGAAFHRRVGEAYRRLADAPHRTLLDAGGTVDQVFARIWQTVEERLRP